MNPDLWARTARVAGFLSASSSLSDFSLTLPCFLSEKGVQYAKSSGFCIFAIDSMGRKVYTDNLFTEVLTEFNLSVYGIEALKFPRWLTKLAQKGGDGWVWTEVSIYPTQVESVGCMSNWCLCLSVSTEETA